jgi:hypothetical protein
VRLLEIVDEEPRARVPQKMLKDLSGAQKGAELRRAHFPIIASACRMR